MYTVFTGTVKTVLYPQLFFSHPVFTGSLHKKFYESSSKGNFHQATRNFMNLHQVGSFMNFIRYKCVNLYKSVYLMYT